MKIRPIEYDGKFEYEGKEIFYFLTDWKMKNNGKVSAFIHFTDKKENLGFTPFFEDEKDAMPIFPDLAKKYYIENIIEKKH